jgi:hypothetical protein
MAMDHKAYAFNWSGFVGELLELLSSSLETGDPSGLLWYIDANRSYLRDPYEGDPLVEDWRDQLESGDVQELGDLALTRFYDPSESCGLSDGWLLLNEQLPKAAQSALLGRTVGAVDALFDPGRMGSYFQTPEDVRESLDVLAIVERTEVAEYCQLLESCRVAGLGLYVTF